MADGQRALAVGRQTTHNTPAATLYPFNFVEQLQITPDIKFDIPNFKVNSPVDQRQAIPTLRGGKITGTLRPDTTDIGWLLLSVMGVPTDSGGNTHDFLHGTLSPPELTFWKLMGLAHAYEQLYNAAITKLAVTMNAAQGTWTGTFEGMGIYDGPKDTPPTLTYAPPPDDSPMAPWQTVLTRTAASVTTAFCVVSATFTLERLYDPLYCSPVTPPTGTTPVGLAPSRQMQGPAHGTYDIVYEYNPATTDTTSSFYNYTRNLPEGWTLQAIDPTTYSPALGYVPTWRVEMPNMKATNGDLAIDRPGTMQHLSGTILWDTTLTSNVKVRLINGLASYAAS